jgi:predicted phage terminase large subunit-like protein
MIFMPPQHGKLLPIDTPILTTKGWVLHGNLKVGDYVFGHDGKPKKVLANSGAYEWNVVNIDFQDGKTIKCAKEHLWKLRVEYDDHKGRRDLICQTKDIFNKKHRRNPYIDCAPSLKLEPKPLPIEPYVLGVWLGDGHSRQGVLTVGSEDINHFSKLGDAREIKKGIYRVLINGLTTKLRENNLLKNKHIPIDYILSSKEQRLELLRGLMDTDGCVNFKGECEFTQKDNQLVKDVYVLLRTLGIKARINYYDAILNGRNVGKKCRVTFNANKAEHLFNLERKQYRINNKIQLDRNDKYKLFIKSINDSNEFVLGNCIQVEGSMYLAGYDLIPTHNSELVSRRLPAWILGQMPKSKIIACSYSADLSSAFNRDVQRCIDDPNYILSFPDTILNGSNVKTTARGGYLRNSEIFEIVNHKGFYKSVGVGGSLTGTPADIGIIDDPVKDAMEAYSERSRNNVWEWYTNVFATRLHNKSKVILTMTRWHEDDLAGRLLAHEADKWDVLKIPAIREDLEDLRDPRQLGEALWNNRHSLERLHDIEQMSKRTFISLYQQRPSAEAGNLIRREWLEVVDLQPNATVNFVCDTAYTGKKENDPSVILAFVEKDNEITITNVAVVRYEFPELLNFLPTFVKQNGGNQNSRMYIEPKATGKSIVQSLKRNSMINVIEDIAPDTDKVARLSGVLPIIESRRVKLLRGAWNENFLTECLAFPNSKHDDQVDCLIMAINKLNKTKLTWQKI